MNRKLLLWLFAAVMAFCGCDNTAVSTEKAPTERVFTPIHTWAAVGT